jgi:predicted nucleic acid-binding Zn ribbon protein
MKETEKRKCKLCGKELPDSKLNRRYCSDKCRIEYLTKNYQKEYVKNWRKKPEVKKRLAAAAKKRYHTNKKYRDYLLNYYRRPEVKKRLSERKKLDRQLFKELLHQAIEREEGGK